MSETKGLTASASPASLSAVHDHAFCLLCGESNPWSLKLSFKPDGDGGVRTSFNSHARLQGYGGILHGGVTAALLDAAMTHCLFHHGVEALTADLHVRYAHAIPCEASLDIWASITTSRPPLYCLRAEVTLDGRLMAWGAGKFLIRTGEYPRTCQR